MTSLINIPDEIWQNEVFSYLDEYEHIKLRQVCKKWNILSNKSIIINISPYDNYYELFQKYCRCNQVLSLKELRRKIVLQGFKNEWLFWEKGFIGACQSNNKNLIWRVLDKLKGKPPSESIELICEHDNVDMFAVLYNKLDLNYVYINRLLDISCIFKSSNIIKYINHKIRMYDEDMYNQIWLIALCNNIMNDNIDMFILILTEIVPNFINNIEIAKHICLHGNMKFFQLYTPSIYGRICSDINFYKIISKTHTYDILVNICKNKHSDSLEMMKIIIIYLKIQKDADLIINWNHLISYALSVNNNNVANLMAREFMVSKS